MYKKADTTGLPEGTDWNTLFEFSNDGKLWTKPTRCADVHEAKWEAKNGYCYTTIRPVTQWEPVPGEVYLFWDNGDEYPRFRKFRGGRPCSGIYGRW